MDKIQAIKKAIGFYKRRTRKETNPRVPIESLCAATFTPEGYKVNLVSDNGFIATIFLVTNNKYRGRFVTPSK